jgi:hypothetical protein
MDVIAYKSKKLRHNYSITRRREIIQKNTPQENIHKRKNPPQAHLTIKTNMAYGKEIHQTKNIHHKKHFTVERKNHYANKFTECEKNVRSHFYRRRELVVGYFPLKGRRERWLPFQLLAKST